MLRTLTHRTPRLAGTSTLSPLRRLATTPPTGSTEVSKEGAAVYCSQLVRDNDYEGFIGSYFYPPSIRPKVLALRALNVELALIPEVAHEVPIARMRYQFWRETIQRAFDGKGTAHPVAVALEGAIAGGSVSKHWLLRSVRAREDDLDAQPFYTLADMDRHTEALYSSLLYAHLELLGIKDVHADHAASHLGKAIGTVAILRGTPHHARARRSYLPVEVAAKSGLSTEDLFRKGPAADGIEDAIHTVASSAHAHLHSAISLRSKAPPSSLPTLLATVPVGRYLDRLEKAQFDPFGASMQKKDWTLPWHMYREFSRLRK